MKASLAKRVERLEEKINPQPKLWITISKFGRPSTESEYLSDRETCRKMGKLNIEAVKLMRSARVAGIVFRKIVKKNSVCPNDDSCCCESGPNMIYEDWVKLMEYY